MFGLCRGRGVNWLSYNFVSICAGSFGGLVGMLYLLVLLCMFSLIGICLFVNWF